MSRFHQGQSSTYQRKLQVRQDRTFDRLVFSCARHFHDKKYHGDDEDGKCHKSERDTGTSDEQDDLKAGLLDRAFIRRWK